MKLQALLLGCLCLASSSVWGSAYLDTFDGGDLSKYVDSDICFQKTPYRVSFVATRGGVAGTRLSGAGTTYDNHVLLTDEASLDVGETLRVDLDATKGSSYADIGLSICALKDPTDWARTNVITAYIKPYYTDFSGYAYNGYTQVTATTINSASISDAVFETISGVFIRRTSSTAYAIGYSIAGVDTDVYSYDMGTNTSIGNAIGLYTDIRAAGVTTLAVDNLRVETSATSTTATPEPTTLLTLIGAACGLALIRRRVK